MNMEKYINELKDNIEAKYRELLLQKDIKENYIIRGHVPSVSSIVENESAIFLSKIMKKDYIFYIDCTVGKMRPDLLIVNSKTKKCELIIEIKSNMGYCRRMEDVSKYVYELKYFKKNNDIKLNYYEYKNAENKKKTHQQVIIKNNNVKMIFLVLTSDNCSEENHAHNRKVLNKNDIQYFNIFSGWYDDLKTNEIKNLCEWLTTNGFL